MKLIKLFIGVGMLAGIGVIVYFGYFKQNIFLKPKSLTPVTIMLKWLHQSQFAGHYVAYEKGWYKDEGLEATIVQFDPYISYIDMVATGAAEFGVAGADEILIARSENKPVIALAVIYQESPVTVYTLKSSGITNVAELKGKRLGHQQSSNVILGIDAMLAAGGLNPQKDVIRKEIGFGISELISGKVDAMTGYMTNEPLSAEEEGYEVNLIKPSQYGIKNYADVLFTSESMIANHPELVRAYVVATLNGWDYALVNQEEAIDITMEYVTDKSMESRVHQKNMLAVSTTLIKPLASFSIGQHSYVYWSRLFEEMKSADMVKKPVIVREVYTTKFLK